MMKIYGKYKPTKGEWIQALPMNWDEIKIKYTSQIIMGQSPNSNDVNIEGQGLPFLQGNGEFTEFHPVAIYWCKSPNKIANINDILISVRAPVGAVNVADQKYGIGRGLCAVRTSQNLRYSYYLSIAIEDELNKMSTGSTFAAINIYNFGSVYVPKVECIEQQKIAEFLDHKTALIDKFITNRKNQIELLEEKKAAIINKAVTKGINPNVKLKPSGVDWIGDIPEHWEVWKVSRSFKVIGSGTTPKAGTPEYYDGGTIPWINTGDLNDSILMDCQNYITEKAFNIHSTLKIYEVGTLLIAMYGATIGKLSILGFKACTNQACCALSLSKNALIDYIFYWLLSNKQHIINMSYGGGQPNISQDIIRSLRIPLPPINEQENILNHIKSETEFIYKIISKYQKQIDLIQEYKTALISKAVTGKIDVRDWQKPINSILNKTEKL